MSFWKLGPTEFRVLTVVVNCFVYFYPNISLMGKQYLLLDVSSILAAACMFLTAVLAITKQTIHLYKLEKV